MERLPLTAYAEAVDGLTLPLGMAGHPALDFCNTAAGWGEPTWGDYLKTFDHLAVWTAAAGLVDPDVVGRLRRAAARAPDEAEAALEEARRFRADLYGVALAPSPGPRWRRVSAGITRAVAAAELVLDEGRAAWRLPDRTGFDLPLLSVARTAEDLLTSDDLPAVRACPGDGCGWLFLDRSGRRRWCTMAVCGNRSKVRRFAERRRAASVN
jgi:predicted RNA-binding Zn ribbon-like protein